VSSGHGKPIFSRQAQETFVLQKIRVLVGGKPAPDINSVINALTI
jgi:hypothetical protein